MKHSPRDIEVEVHNLLLPAPKRKGGNWASGFLIGRVFVEYPFALDRDGRSKMDFLLLELMFSRYL